MGEAHQGREPARGRHEGGCGHGRAADHLGGAEPLAFSVPNAQPASLEMTTPAAMSWVASPRKVQA